MKYTLIISFLISQSLQAQYVVVNEMGLMEAQQIFEFPEKSADQIYKQAKLWLNGFYKNPSSVTTGDIEGKAIKGKGASSCGAVMKGLIPVCFDLGYRFSIDIKEGRARITINDFQVGGDQGSYSGETYCVKNKTGEFRTNSQARAIIPGFEKICADHMESFSKIFEVTSDDDW